MLFFFKRVNHTFANYAIYSEYVLRKTLKFDLQKRNPN